MTLDGCFTDVGVTLENMFVTLEKLGFLDGGVVVNGSVMDIRNGFFILHRYNIHDYIRKYFPR